MVFSTHWYCYMLIMLITPHLCTNIYKKMEAGERPVYKHIPCLLPKDAIIENSPTFKILGLWIRMFIDIGGGRRETELITFSSSMKLSWLHLVWNWVELSEFWPESQRNRYRQGQRKKIIASRKYHRDSLRNGGFWDRDLQAESYLGVLSSNCEDRQHQKTEYKLAYSCSKDTMQCNGELWLWGGSAEMPSVEGRGSVLCPVNQTSPGESWPWKGSITLGKATPLESRTILAGGEGVLAMVAHQATVPEPGGMVSPSYRLGSTLQQPLQEGALLVHGRSWVKVTLLVSLHILSPFDVGGWRENLRRNQVWIA